MLALEKQLIELEWRYRRAHGFGWSDQSILLPDPVGHLIEIRQPQLL